MIYWLIFLVSFVSGSNYINNMQPNYIGYQLGKLGFHLDIRQIRFSLGFPSLSKKNVGNLYGF